MKTWYNLGLSPYAHHIKMNEEFCLLEKEELEMICTHSKWVERIKKKYSDLDSEKKDHFLSFVNNKVVELRAIEKLNNSFIPCVIAGFISALLVKVIYDCGLDDLSGSGVGVVFFYCSINSRIIVFPALLCFNEIHGI